MAGAAAAAAADYNPPTADQAQAIREGISNAILKD
jgi:hypothetical protein